MDMINDAQNQFYLQILGSIILLIFGVFCYRSNPMKNMHKSGNQKGSLIHNGITAFLVTFSNPLIIFLFLALYAQFSFGLQLDKPIELVAGFISIVGGALLWWWGLTWLVDVIRLKFDNNGIRIINRIIGTLVIVGSVIVLLTTLFSLHLYNIF
jgi:threonine/homoserine/homoserine lactone efflux protein